MHYDLEKNVVLGAKCINQEKKATYDTTKKEDAYLSTGCSDWEKARVK